MTVLFSRHAALSSLALAIGAPAALAQSANTPSMAAVLVTATRSPQLASEIISDSLRIDAEQIARSGAGSLIDLLQRQRGIEVARNGGPGTNSSVFIRGANSNQNIVLVDGVRIGSATSGAASWNAIPLNAIDHIEIVYGPLSSLYGADAIGGVIQIFTKQGQGAPSLSAVAGYGSDNTRSADVAVSGASGGEHSFSYALSAGQEKSDGFSATRPTSSSYNADRDGYKRQDAGASFGLKLAPGHDIGLRLLASDLDAQYDSGATSYDTRSRQKLENHAVYSKNQILPFWRSLLQLSEARDKSATSTGTLAKNQSQIDTRQTDLTWQNDVQIGADTLQLLYSHRKEEVESKPTQQVARQRLTDSFAASYNMRRDAHLFNAAVRNDDIEQVARGSSPERDSAKTTASAGYAYVISPALRASVSYGSSFRVPTFNELYFPSYGVESNQPEQGHNAEAGLRYKDKDTELTAAYYRNRLSNLLVSTNPCPFDPKTYSFGCAYNVSQAVLEGWSLAASRQLGSFTLNGNLDLQDPRDTATGTTLARRSKRHANLALDYAAGALKAGVELELSGQRFDDAANKIRLGGYGLLNLVASYQFNADWSALLRWNNIADKQYDLARNYATPGSKLFAAIRYGYK